MNAGPRIAPGGREQIGLVNLGIAKALGMATGGPPPNLFTTLARHRGLFRKWLRFAGALMPGGSLPRADSELLILRVAHNTGCEYEWRHHERLAATAGLSAEEIERVRLGPGAEGWSTRQAALLRAADELHAERRISDPLWAELSGLLSEPKLIELCMLVGHYEMLAMTINSLAIEPDEPGAGSPPRAMRLLRAIERRRGRAGGGTAS
ncbi:MAG: carboxymuconolactone decarboxylase family protein [Solirubrobacterales bacterium]